GGGRRQPGGIPRLGGARARGARVKLLHLLPSAFYGGPETQILLMAVRLRARYGHESSFLIMPPRGRGLEGNEFVERLRAQGFPVREFRTPAHYDFAGAIRLLRKEV